MVGIPRRAEPGTTRTYTMSIPVDLYDEVARLAEANGRSMNRQLGWYVREGVERDQARERKAGAAA